MDGPETVRKHQSVGKQEEQANPQERRDGNKRFVSARVHGRDRGDYSRTRMASATEKINSCSPERGPRAEIRTRRSWPPQLTSSNSLAPLKNCCCNAARNRAVPGAVASSDAKRIASGRKEKMAGPLGPSTGHC